MPADTTGKLYDQFAPPEWLTLVLEALARDDGGEVRRLAASCPRKAYTAPDLEFGDRVRVAFDTVAVVCIDLRALNCRLHALHWAVAAAREMATLHQINADMAFLDGFLCGKGRPQIEFYVHDEKAREPATDAVADDDPDALAAVAPHFSARMATIEDRAQRSTDCILQPLARAACAVATEFVTAWRAFGRFCRERLGVPPETMLEAWGFPVPEDYRATAEQYDHVKPDPADVDEYFRHVCVHWDRRFGGGEEGGAARG
jgi:hypothetical protein